MQSIGETIESQIDSPLSWPAVTRAIAVVAKGDLLQTVALDIDGSRMCGNLTDQVRNIAHITTAVARRDLSREIAVDVRGEILELKDTIDTMANQFNAFASEVTRVAHEVGTEGKLGGLSALTMWRHR